MRLMDFAMRAMGMIVCVTGLQRVRNLMQPRHTEASQQEQADEREQTVLAEVMHALDATL
ncbi:MAG: hypothetical protein AAGI08_03055 [Bacteroidota bacterium]